MLGCRKHFPEEYSYDEVVQVNAVADLGEILHYTVLEEFFSYSGISAVGHIDDGNRKQRNEHPVHTKENSAVMGKNQEEPNGNDADQHPFQPFIIDEPFVVVISQDSPCCKAIHTSRRQHQHGKN